MATTGFWPIKGSLRDVIKYADNPDTQLTAFYDLNAARAQELAERYGAKAYDSVEALLADPDVDAVSICSSNTSHAQIAVAALEAGKSALTFAAKDAIQNAGNVATGEMSGSEFAKQIAGSAAGGVAGNIMSGLVSSGIARVLTEKQMMTPFMLYLKNVAGSMAFSTGSLAANTAISGRKMSGEEIATELTTSFAFALVNGYMQSITESKAASQAVRQRYEQIAQEFEAIQKHMSGKQFATQAEYEQALKDLRAHVQELKTEVSSTYYGGQQEFVNSMKDALDVVVNNLNWMLSGNTGAAPASGASGMPAADVKLLTEQAASALRSGANEPIGPQGGAAGSLAQAESTAVNSRA